MRNVGVLWIKIKKPTIAFSNDRPYILSCHKELVLKCTNSVQKSIKKATRILTLNWLTQGYRCFGLERGRGQRGVLNRFRYPYGFLRSDKPSLNPVEPGRVDGESVKSRKHKDTFKGNRTPAASRGTKNLGKSLRQRLKALKRASRAFLRNRFY